MTESVLYHEGNRRLQDAFDSRRAAPCNLTNRCDGQDFIPVAAPPTS